MKKQNENLRNIAIIAHVDHGKTTLIDNMIKQGETFASRHDLADRVMDSMDLERERGITIASKNCSVFFQKHKINIIDTPGHADFGGEVERALKMADGAILLVDAAEGPLPQTRFVLKKALEGHLKLIVVVNKIDRQDARAQEVLNEVYDLFIDLDADEDQIEFPVLYAIGRDGVAKHQPEDESKDLKPLFETILEKIPAPNYDDGEPFQMLVTNLGYSDYLGRLAIGRVFEGSAKKNDQLVCLGESGEPKKLKVNQLQVYEGIQIQSVDQVDPGEIVLLSGIEEVVIGDTICHESEAKALPRITVDEPTVAMSFGTNTSPMSGREGKWVQSRKIWERLQKEILHNVALQIERGQGDEDFIVKGRGELQMAILVETMRREGFEMSVGRPQIIFKDIDGVKQEPIEHLFLDVPEECVGVITEKLAQRQGKMTNLVNHGSGRVRMEFSIPTRGLIGYRSEFLTDTKGLGIMNSILHGYEAVRGNIQHRLTGSLVSDRAGSALPYALFNLEPRGVLYIEPGTEVYEGMIIGEHNRNSDLNVNPTKAKKLTNIRASGKDTNVILTPVLPITLERALEFIRDDELVEVTPKSIRLRKKVLASNMRK